MQNQVTNLYSLRLVHSIWTDQNWPATSRPSYTTPYKPFIGLRQPGKAGLNKLTGKSYIHKIQKNHKKRLQWSRASASRLDWLQRNYSVNRRQSARAVNTGSVNRALSEIRQLKLNEITFGPVYAMALCPSVCMSVFLQVGFVSKWLDESSLFLVWRLPSTYPRLCCKEIWISADTSGHDVSRLYYYRARKACAMEVKS